MRTILIAALVAATIVFGTSALASNASAMEAACERVADRVVRMLDEVNPPPFELAIDNRREELAQRLTDMRDVSCEELDGLSDGTLRLLVLGY